MFAHAKEILIGQFTGITREEYEMNLLLLKQTIHLELFANSLVTRL